VLDPEFYEEGRRGSGNRDVHAGIIVDYIPVTYPKLTIIDAFPEIPVKMDVSGSGADRSVHADYIPHAHYETYLLILFDQASRSEHEEIRPYQQPETSQPLVPAGGKPIRECPSM